MQIASSRIWTWFAVPTSYDDNRYTNSATSLRGDLSSSHIYKEKGTKIKNLLSDIPWEENLTFSPFVHVLSREVKA